MNGQQDQNQDINELTGADRARAVYDFFINKGWLPAQAAGIVGGLRGETENFNPKQLHDNGMGLGIAGWNGDRLAGLRKFAAQNGTSPTDLNTQLEYVNHELHSSEAGAGQLLSMATNPVQAGNATLAYFRPSNWNVPGAHPERAQYANQAFDSFTGNAPLAFSSDGNAALDKGSVAFKAGEIFKRFGIGGSQSQQAAPSNIPKQTEQPVQPVQQTGFNPGDVFKQFGVGEQPKSAAAPVAAPQQESNIPKPVEAMTPEERAFEAEHTYKAPTIEDRLQKIREATSPATVIPEVAGAVGSEIAKEAQAGWQAIKGAASQQNWLPTFGAVPRTITNLKGEEVPATGFQIKEPGRIGAAAGGAAQIAASPISGPIQELVTKPLTNITGNPEFAEKASLFVPVGPIARIAHESHPVVRALNDVAQSVPEEYLPEALSRVERNPTLTLPDVSASARMRLATIHADQAAPEAIDYVNKFISERNTNKRAAIADAADVLGSIPDPATIINKLNENVKGAGSKINDVITSAKAPVEITDVVKGIDKELSKVQQGRPTSQLQDELVNLREQLRGSWADRDKMFLSLGGEQGLHQLQSDLRVQAQRLIDKGGSGASVGKQLLGYREKLLNAADKVTDGKYRQSLTDYRIAQEALPAFERGLNIDKTPGRSIESIMETSPSELRAWANNPNTAKTSLDSARYGALAWAKKEIDGWRSGGKLEGTPNNPALRERLEVLFGKPATDQFVQEMRDAHSKTQTVNMLSNQSKTANILSGMEVRPIRVAGKKQSDIGGLTTTLRSLVPIGAGLATEWAAPGYGGGLAGAGLGAAYAAGKFGKYLYEKNREARDLVARLEEARRLTTPVAQQPDLLAIMRERAQSIGGGNKISNLLTAPVSAALPR